MTFNSDRYEGFAAPEILLHAVEDDAGSTFLLLHGAEPDYQWERFTAAVTQLVERLGVLDLHDDEPLLVGLAHVVVERDLAVGAVGVPAVDGAAADGVEPRAPGDLARLFQAHQVGTMMPAASISSGWIRSL